MTIASQDAPKETRRPVRQPLVRRLHAFEIGDHLREPLDRELKDVALLLLDVEPRPLELGELVVVAALLVHLGVLCCLCRFGHFFQTRGEPVASFPHLDDSGIDLVERRPQEFPGHALRHGALLGVEEEVLNDGHG